jgi:hypothetical protein
MALTDVRRDERLDVSVAGSGQDRVRGCWRDSASLLALPVGVGDAAPHRRYATGQDQLPVRRRQARLTFFDVLVVLTQGRPWMPAVE